MSKNIVCYSLGSIEPRKRTKFNKELYGYIDKSNHSKYTYERKGILTKIPFQKPLASVIILASENAKKVIKHLKKYKARYINYQIKEPAQE